MGLDMKPQHAVLLALPMVSVSLSHHLADKRIFGTFNLGPSLRGANITMLAEMPAGGSMTL